MITQHHSDLQNSDGMDGQISRNSRLLFVLLLPHSWEIPIRVRVRVWVPVVSCFAISFGTLLHSHGKVPNWFHDLPTKTDGFPPQSGDSAGGPRFQWPSARQADKDLFLGSSSSAVAHVLGCS